MGIKNSEVNRPHTIESLVPIEPTPEPEPIQDLTVEEEIEDSAQEEEAVEEEEEGRRGIRRS
jgi:hypothetical protein